MPMRFPRNGHESDTPARVDRLSAQPLGVCGKQIVKNLHRRNGTVTSLDEKHKNTSQSKTAHCGVEHKVWWTSEAFGDYSLFAFVLALVSAHSVLRQIDGSHPRFSMVCRSHGKNERRNERRNEHSSSTITYRGRREPNEKL
mmetsp:Transcript_3529/g.9901  ORF Transcript_3529/g.9901 Transcript_3529/m.9901 type:complete len:142 (-) Transcript_3529:1588-2013(-)